MSYKYFFFRVNGHTESVKRLDFVCRLQGDSNSFIFRDKDECKKSLNETLLFL